jgi:hypothetical protein
MSDPIYTIGSAGNIYVRMMTFSEEGTQEPSHKHIFDHIQILATGSVKITVNEQESIHHAPKMIYIKKNILHSILALEPGTTLMCVHGLREGYGGNDIIPIESIPAGVELEIGSDLPSGKRVLPLTYVAASDQAVEYSKMETVYVDDSASTV